MTTPGPDRRVLLKRTAGILLTGLGVVLLLVMAGGFYGIGGQWWINHTYRSTPAQIIADKLLSISSNGFLYYRPQITYRYVVGGKAYTAHTIRGHTRVGTKPWAAATLSLYPRGARCTVWYNPSHPQTARLVRPFSFGFYLMVIVPVMIGLIVIWARRTVLVPLIGPPFNLDPQPTDDGRFVLKPRHSIFGQIKFWLATLGTWLGMMALTFGQYAAMAGRHYQSLATISLVFCGLLALVPLVLLLRWCWIAWRMDEPRITIDQARPKMGQTVEWCVSLRLRRNMELEAIPLEMSCHRQALFVSDLLRSGSQLVEDIPWLSAQTMVEAQSVKANTPLTGSAAFELPTELEPIPRFKIKPGRVMLRWQGKINIVVKGRRIYQGVYPLSVEFATPRAVAHAAH